MYPNLYSLELHALYPQKTPIRDNSNNIKLNIFKRLLMIEPNSKLPPTNKLSGLSIYSNQDQIPVDTDNIELKGYDSPKNDNIREEYQDLGLGLANPTISFKIHNELGSKDLLEDSDSDSMFDDI